MDATFSGDKCLKSAKPRHAHLESKAQSLGGDMSGDEARDLETVVDQGMVRAQNALRFFDLEWIALDDAIALPLIEAAAAFLNDMASFESAGVSDKE